jgi:hypothetical protein
LSTHAIGPVRLLLGSLVLLFVGATGYWWLSARVGAGHDVLVLRDGPVEVEPWTGELRPEGSALRWDHTVSGIQLLIAKAQSDDEEYVLMDPITVPDAKSLIVDFRVGNVRTIERAMVLSMDASGVKIAVNEGELTKKGDVWAHAGFVQNGQRKKFEIARLEFRDGQDHVITRYQNPDMGRRVRFRVRMTGTAVQSAH